MARIPYTTKCRYRERWSQLDTDFSQWRRRYMDLSEAYLPVSGRFLQRERNQAANDFNSIYDSTGTMALNTLASGLMAGLTSPARPWFRLSTTDAELVKYESVKIWLNDVTKKMQSIFAASNTYNGLHQVYSELGLYGTGCSILVDNFKDVIRLETMTAGEYRLATDYEGRANTMYRTFEKTVAELVQEFGLDACSPQVQNMYSLGNLGAYIPVVHLIEPRSDRDPSKRDARNMAWRSVYFEEGENSDKVLRESGFTESRLLAPRWVTYGGDTYGISPGMLSLGDVRQLNHEQLRKAQAIDYQVDPPLVLPVSAKSSQINLLPGGTSFIDTTNPSGVQTAFNVNLRLDFLLADIQDVRQRINSAFYVDLLKMLTQSDRSNMTATEVAERHEEKLLMLGPVLERQHNELLSPLVEMTFNRMVRTGLVGAPPPELQGRELQIEFVSMLAQAQRAIGTNGIDRFVTALGQVSAIKPDVLDKFNSDEWVDVYSDMLGVDPNLIVADKDVAIVRQQRAAAQQAQVNGAAMSTAADMANKLANAPLDGDNALSAMTRNITSPV